MRHGASSRPSPSGRLRGIDTSRRVAERPNDDVRVLVVDDNPVNLLVTSALLESRGVIPLVASNGVEALTHVRQLQFDLILMDLEMPILNGFEATEAIRRVESACSRPAVTVIAYSNTSPSITVLSTHLMSGSLAKPCDAQDLEDCLIKWCPAYVSSPPTRARR